MPTYPAWKLTRRLVTHSRYFAKLPEVLGEPVVRFALCYIEIEREDFGDIGPTAQNVRPAYQRFDARIQHGQISSTSVRQR